MGLLQRTMHGEQSLPCMAAMRPEWAVFKLLS
jgi:hypothetical protein